MAELLFEIFSEEIPARMQVRAGEDLVRLMNKALSDAGLSPKDSRALTGPRRLTYVTDVETRSPDVSEERKGPRVGAPERALEGFMRGAGISDISQAETRTDKKGEYYVAVIQSEGRDTADILREAIPAVMGDFSWPKSMTSGDSDFRWVRPLRGLTILLDGQSLDGIMVGGIGSDAQVHGHRQMGPGPYQVSTLADYETALTAEGHVMIDRAARRDRVLEQARAVCAEAGLALVEDAGLLDEVTGLVEWPVALLGDMDPAFLELPDEVIRLTLKSHQKTFTVKGQDGKLAPHFVILANLETPDGGETIKAGNAKVISARLADAKFFQDEDRKQPLAAYYDRLDEVVFHKKLGSVRDKAERVAALAREIAPHVGADPNVAERAAKLAKCDLVTQTVIEATSLQGQVGRWMYEHDVAQRRADSLLAGSGESGGFSEADHHAIAVAIEDHYKPQGPSDAVPTDPVAVAVALADKIDTLVGFWAIDEKPTGSKDPYALRRAALGLVRLCLDNKLNFELFPLLFWPSFKAVMNQSEVCDELVSELSDALLLHRIHNERQPSHTGTISYDLLDEARHFYVSDPKEFSKFEASIKANGLVDHLLAFLLDRLRVYLRDQGHRHDVIDAVIAQGGDDLLAISQRVEALGAFLSDTNGEDLVQGYKRAANILRAEEKKGGSNKGSSPAPVAGALSKASSQDASGGEGLGQIPAMNAGDEGSVVYTAPEAAALAQALTGTRPAIDAALQAADYPAALSALADLREPIDTFFEAVVVNADDPDARARRLALLSAVVDTFHRIADFSRLDG